MNTKIELTPSTYFTVLDYLSGKISTRAAGAKLGVSHQQFINFTTSFVKDWYMKGILKVELPENLKHLGEETNENNT